MSDVPTRSGAGVVDLANTQPEEEVRPGVLDWIKALAILTFIYLAAFKYWGLI